jgi:hypothetical protein
MDVCNFEHTVKTPFVYSLGQMWEAQPGVSSHDPSSHGRCVMTCLSCRSVNQAELTAEMIIHFRGLGNVDKPGVWLFPNLTVCLDCGFSRFAVPEIELASVAEGHPGR